MSWKETCTMNERELFIKAWREHNHKAASMCARYGVSRKTGYKWIERFKAEGMTGLSVRSRARLMMLTEDSVIMFKAGFSSIK